MDKKRRLFILLICVLFLTGPRPTAALAAGSPPDIKAAGPVHEVRVSTFGTKEEAERFVEKIRSGGYEAVIRSEITDDKKTVYAVYVVVHGGKRTEEQPAGETAEGETPAGEASAGTLKSYPGLFTEGQRFYHASLALSQLVTDNAFLSRDNKKSGSSTVLSPEVWILLPHTEQEPPGIQSISTGAAGGMTLSRLKPEVSRRYEAYLLYHADIPLYSNLPAAKTIIHNVLGGFIYNGNRVYLNVGDQFTRSYDVKVTGVPSDPVEVDKYKTNLFSATAAYDTGNRVSFRVDYSNFLLNYDETANDFMARMDNSVAGYLFYKVKPKTALFLEYAFVDIAHGKDGSFDSMDHDIFGGIQWDITAKSRGTIKAGYGIKDFSNRDTRWSSYIFEAQIEQRLSSKNTLAFTAYRQTDETDFVQTSFVVADGAKAELRHLLTARMSASAAAEYTRESYEGGSFTSGGVTGQRRDNIYQGELSFRYEFKKWLQADIGYTLTKRDSNFTDFGYTANSLYFRIMTGI